MTVWVPAHETQPADRGWYPVLSDWRTATLHPGSRLWLGSKWASAAPDRITFFCPEAFEEPHAASGRAFTLEAANRIAENANEPVVERPLAAAAG